MFVIPRKGGRLVEAGRKPGVRYRDARFMPDGKTLLMFSDESGEVELWTVAADGARRGDRLTTDGAVLRRMRVPSPDWQICGTHRQKSPPVPAECRDQGEQAAGGIDGGRVR